MGRCAILVSLVIAGCYAPAPQPGAPCSTQRDCPDPLVCSPQNRCEAAGGAIDAPIDTGPPPMCGPDEAPCVGGACGAATCLHPGHVATGFGTFVVPTLQSIVLAEAVLDTRTGAITGARAPNTKPDSYEVIGGIGFVRATQGNGEPIAIWVVGSLAITGSVTATGDASVVLASATALTIGADGVLDLGARGLVPGPGGQLGGTFRTAGAGCGGGGAPTGTGTSGDTGSTNGGAGGGGFGTNGGAGGSGVGGPGAAGNASACADLLVTTLVGGSGGGGGDTSGTVPGPFGGGGGGALQLTAMGELTIQGRITVGGGGGRTAEGNSRDGAGGGSGGTVFLEAPVLTLGPSAGVFANGGGGGSASAGAGSACSGPLAEDGKPSLVAAAGSRCASGFGGNGAAGDAPASAGQSANAAGGGGGGLGQIVTRTLPGHEPTIATSNLSPAPTSPAFHVLPTLD
ncbi:MAG TPA: hypothetical protein VFQ53_35280 [Kofleriaceae bacterium]|nr:hypothetical protein [Kofleriaceae bacterium]